MDFHARNLTSVDSSKSCPYERARDIYLSEPCVRTFEEDFHNHLRHGVVVSTPRAFVMARRADRWADPRDIVDSAHVFDGGDCLHIFLASGDLREIVRLLELSDHVHGRLEWLSWERDNVLRFYRRESLMSHGAIIASIKYEMSSHV